MRRTSDSSTFEIIWRVGAGEHGALLRATQLGRRDHLHGLGDLPRVLDTADATPKIEYVCHGLFGRSRFFPRSFFLGLAVGEEVGLVVFDGGGEAALEVVVERLLGGDVGEDAGCASLEVGIEAVLEGAEVR